MPTPPKLKKPPALKATPNFSLLEELYALGYKKIIGVDEVGRGALAGPIVVAAVEIDLKIDGINDSKQITKPNRQLLADILHRQSKLIRIGYCTHKEIDERGVTEALRLAYKRALDGIQADLVLTDHFTLPTDHRHIRATKGDSLFYSVAAASIVAKVYRDQLMKVYAHFFPGYGWEQNAGYGTVSHLQAIKDSGATPIHRQSFL